MGIGSFILSLLAAKIVVGGVLQSTEITSLRLSHGDSQCINEMFNENDDIVLKVAASSNTGHANAHTLSIKLSDDKNLLIVNEDIDISKEVEYHSFERSLKSFGSYQLCFTYTFLEGKYEREPLKIHFGFDLNVRESKNEAFFSTRTGKNYISHVERELAQVEDVLYYIDDKYDEDRRRELQLIEATESTAAFIGMMGTLSITILLITSLTQTFYLKHYLSTKKVL